MKVFAVLDMNKCLVCGEAVTETCTRKEGWKCIVTVLSKVFNTAVPDCQCIQNVICLKCHATFRRLIDRKKSCKAKQSWKNLGVLFNLPSALLSEVGGCSKCQVTKADASDTNDVHQKNVSEADRSQLNSQRVDLEKVRTLCYMVVKREKLKRELVISNSKIITLELEEARRGHSEIDTGTSGEQNDCETLTQPDMEVELHASEKEQQVKSSQEEPSMPEKVLFL